MAFDAFVKFDGIPGESTDDEHKDWIEIRSFSTGVSQASSGAASTGGGASAERSDFQDFTLVKTVDMASPKLARACADGTHIKEVVVELCRAGGDKMKYMEYKMSNVIISSWKPSGFAQGETLPVEEVCCNYGKIEWTYIKQMREGGRGGGNVATGWDLQANKKL